MPVDQRHAGRTYPPTEPYTVTRHLIREFADVVGITHPACFDVEAARALGHVDLVAPPTFAIVVTRRASRQVTHDPAIGLDYARVVHGEQRFDLARPIVAGDELAATVTLESVVHKGAMTFLTTRTDLHGARGDLVVTARSTLVERGGADERS
ncbi:FAS1-like dehydratase domain-containing protein [Nocardioides humi]|uniref:UPF0336 protein GCM10009788_39760 n=1 Tax=Nocardioides humi TaxID=449461 RepID=A0ABN2B2Q4_9ACTN|nr:MaoC family dehydratase N-terminal domain-containing protein [Nocardioides humi]